MVNLFADIPGAAVAKQTISFAAAGLSNTNIRIIFEVGSPLKSWVPGRSINSISGFTADKGYYIMPKISFDLSEIVWAGFEPVLVGITDRNGNVITDRASSQITTF